MKANEKRHHPRISALNLISYNCIDETDSVVAQGMGRTLNISEAGMLLETHVAVDPKYFISLAIGLENEVVNIKGRIIRSASGKDEKFETGIVFIEIDETAINILNKYIQAFKEQ